MLPIQKKISSYNHFNSNNIKYIVVHDVGTKSTAKNNIDYFYGGNRNASAHYFVDDNSIWQSVEDSKGAWHVGDGGNKYGINNQNSIGVEMCLPSGKVTAKTEQNTVELVRYLMKKYNIPVSRVVRHYDASRKNCPAQFNLDGKWTRWNSFKNKIEGGSSVTKKVIYQETPGLYEALRDDTFYLEKELKRKSAWTIKKGQRFFLEDIVKSGKYTRAKVRLNNDVRYCTLRDDFWKLVYKTKPKKIK